MRGLAFAVSGLRGTGFLIMGDHTSCPLLLLHGGFPKLGVPSLGVPIIKIIVYWGLYWGPLILGNYHIAP